jgi:hypothetical protein
MATFGDFEQVVTPISREQNRATDEQALQRAFDANSDFFVRRGIGKTTLIQLVEQNFGHLRERSGGPASQNFVQNLVFTEAFSVDAVSNPARVQGYAIDAVPSHAAADYYHAGQDTPGIAALFVYPEEVPASFDNSPDAALKLVRAGLHQAVSVLASDSMWTPGGATEESSAGTSCYDHDRVVSCYRFRPSEQGGGGGRGMVLLYIRVLATAHGMREGTKVGQVVEIVQRQQKAYAETVRKAAVMFYSSVLPDFDASKVRRAWVAPLNTFAFDNKFNRFIFCNNCYHHHGSNPIHQRTSPGPVVVFDRDKCELIMAFDRPASMPDLKYVRDYAPVVEALDRGIAQDVPYMPIWTSALNMTMDAGGARPEQWVLDIRGTAIETVGPADPDDLPVKLGAAYAKTLVYDLRIKQKFPAFAKEHYWFALAADAVVAQSAVFHVGGMDVLTKARFFARTGQKYLAIHQKQKGDIAAAMALLADSEHLDMDSLRMMRDYLHFPVELWTTGQGTPSGV